MFLWVGICNNNNDDDDDASSFLSSPSVFYFRPGDQLGNLDLGIHPFLGENGRVEEASRTGARGINDNE